MKISTLFSLNLLVLLHMPASRAFPAPHGAQLASFERPQASARGSKLPLYELGKTHENERVNTVAVGCYPDYMVITVKADMFEIGTPVNGDELRFGVGHEDFCRAVASDDEYKIIVGLSDCGTKHWMTESTLIYTNLLIYSPMVSQDGLIRMEEAVIPIECHYERKYSLSSASLKPTWVPFTSTQSAVESLDFDFRVMTSDWLYERSSNVFYLGEPIYMEASVRVGHHMGLRVFMSSCVATLYPDRHSTPRYVFIENDGCLVDSQLQGSHSQFLPRTQDDKLQLVMDAFRFHQEERGELYITCQLTAAPVTIAAESQPKACTYINGRWRSADGNDYLCGYCGGETGLGQIHGKPSSSGPVGPRSHGKPAVSNSFWKTGSKEHLWEGEESVGPILVLPTKRSGFIAEEDLPPVLAKIGRPVFHGSQWRSGKIAKTDLDKGLVLEPLSPTPEPRPSGAMNKSNLNSTSGQEEEEEDYDVDEVKDVASFNSTIAIPQKMLDNPSVLSYKVKVDTPMAHSDASPTNPEQEGKNAEIGVTEFSQKTEEMPPMGIAPKK